MNNVRLLTVLGKVVWFKSWKHLTDHYGNLYTLRTNPQGHKELHHKGHGTLIGIVEDVS